MLVVFVGHIAVVELTMKGLFRGQLCFAQIVYTRRVLVGIDTLSQEQLQFFITVRGKDAFDDGMLCQVRGEFLKRTAQKLERVDESHIDFVL